MHKCIREWLNQTKRAPNRKYASRGDARSLRGMNTPNLVGLLSACTALIATIVGPLVALTVARRQFIATAISGNRHKWIENLRDVLAELISLLAAALVVKSKWKDRWERGRGPRMAAGEVGNLTDDMILRSLR